MKAKTVGVSDFMQLLEGDYKRLSKFPINPLIFDIDEKFSKVKSAMRKGTFLHVEPGRKKEVKAKYDKRIIFIKDNGEFDTEPLHIEDGICINYKHPALNIVASKSKRGKKKVELRFGDLRGLHDLD